MKRHLLKRPQDLRAAAPSAARHDHERRREAVREACGGTARSVATWHGTIRRGSAVREALRPIAERTGLAPHHVADLIRSLSPTTRERRPWWRKLSPRRLAQRAEQRAKARRRMERESRRRNRGR